MDVRFRYLADGGREIRVATEADLALEILSGRIREDTLLYDAHGVGWAPARNHSVFLTASGAPGRSSGEPRAPEPRRELPDFPLTLATAPSFAPEEEVARLMRDRPENPVRVHPLDEGLRVEPWHDAPPRAGAGPADVATGGGGGPSAASRRRRSPRRPRRRGSSSALPGGTRAPAGRAPLRVGPAAPPPRGRPVTALGALTAAMAATACILLVSVLLGDTRLGGGAQHIRADVIASAEGLGEPGPGGRLADPSAPEALAFEDFVAAVGALQQARGATRVPAAWLEGTYLSDAGRYPEVRAYWERYGVWLAEVRRQESELFRRALHDRLAAEGASGAVQSLSVARALRAFDADTPRRVALYEALEELAGAAVALHDLLVERQADISFEPARGSGVSRDPVLEAVAEDPRLQAEIGRLLIRVFSAMEAAGGQRVAPRDEVPGLLQRGLATAPRPVSR